MLGQSRNATLWASKPRINTDAAQRSAPSVCEKVVIQRADGSQARLFTALPPQQRGRVYMTAASNATAAATRALLAAEQEMGIAL